METLLEYLPSADRLLLGLGLFLVSFVVSLVLVGWVVVQLPATYFKKDHPPTLASFQGHPAVRVLALAAKNALGLLLIVIGLALSLPGVPGQGFLTILVGLMLLNFPGKRRLELAIVRLPAVTRAINALRRRYGKPPLEFDEE